MNDIIPDTEFLHVDPEVVETYREIIDSGKFWNRVSSDILDGKEKIRELVYSLYIIMPTRIDDILYQVVGESIINAEDLDILPFVDNLVYAVIQAHHDGKYQDNSITLVNTLAFAREQYWAMDIDQKVKLSRIFYIDVMTIFRRLVNIEGTTYDDGFSPKLCKSRLDLLRCFVDCDTLVMKLPPLVRQALIEMFEWFGLPLSPDMMAESKRVKMTVNPDDRFSRKFANTAEYYV